MPSMISLGSEHVPDQLEHVLSAKTAWFANELFQQLGLAATRLPDHAPPSSSPPSRTPLARRSARGGDPNYP
jgi:hypothetical protein